MGDRPDNRNGAGSDMARGMSQASYGLAVAFAFSGIVLVGWLIGKAIDNWLDIEPWMQVVGAIAGWVLGVFVVIYASKRELD
jgi:F0F1-type ATP synthase assembly protein I